MDAPDIAANEYREIEAMIADASSPVGIDAKKTHVLILHKLMSIERRLAANVERRNRRRRRPEKRHDQDERANQRIGRHYAASVGQDCPLCA